MDVFKETLNICGLQIRVQDSTLGVPHGSPLFCNPEYKNPTWKKWEIFHQTLCLFWQTEEIAQRAEWCRRYAQINSVALRKVTLGKSPSTPSELYFTVNLCGQRHISCKKVLVLVPHVLDLHDFQFCSYAAEHPSKTES